MATNEMEDYKAPGTDDITSDFIKIGGEETPAELAKLNT